MKVMIELGKDSRNTSYHRWKLLCTKIIQIKNVSLPKINFIVEDE